MISFLKSHVEVCTGYIVSAIFLNSISDSNNGHFVSIKLFFSNNQPPPTKLYWRFFSKKLTCFSIFFGSIHSSSLSNNAIYLPLAAFIQLFRLIPIPRFWLLQIKIMLILLESYDPIRLQVLSVEPSSTTMISKGLYVWFFTESNARGRVWARL